MEIAAGRTHGFFIVMGGYGPFGIARVQPRRRDPRGCSSALASVKILNHCRRVAALSVADSGSHRPSSGTMASGGTPPTTKIAGHPKTRTSSIGKSERRRSSTSQAVPGPLTVRSRRRDRERALPCRARRDTESGFARALCQSRWCGRQRHWDGRRANQRGARRGRYRAGGRSPSCAR
jgi:hypothetical protein